MKTKTAPKPRLRPAPLVETFEHNRPGRAAVEAAARVLWEQASRRREAAKEAKQTETT